jgi:hypothetical protein
MEMCQSESCDKVPTMATPAYQWQRARSMAWRYWHTSTIRHLALTVLNLDRLPKVDRRAVFAWELPAKLTRAVAHVKAQQEPPA